MNKVEKIVGCELVKSKKKLLKRFFSKNLAKKSVAIQKISESFPESEVTIENLQIFSHPELHRLSLASNNPS